MFLQEQNKRKGDKTMINLTNFRMNYTIKNSLSREITSEALFVVLLS